MKGIPYLTAVGYTVYVAMGMHIDVAFTVQHLSQFSSNLGQAHWTVAQRLISATRGHVLILRGPEEIRLHGFTDSDWVANVDNCQSVSGYVFSLGHGAISWSLKKQATVATSSTEAKYMVSCHAMWLCALLRLIGHEQKKGNFSLMQQQWLKHAGKGLLISQMNKTY